jgi:hypothetical protein
MRQLALMSALALAACLWSCGDSKDEQPVEPEPEVEQHACGAANEHVFVLTTLTFGRESPPGVTQGLDLDGIDSDANDASGCYKADMTDPEGNAGIDNQFARIVPGLIAVGGEAIEGLIQQAINSGELLLVARLAYVDDLDNDECVEFELIRGLGAPLVGTHGLPLSGQTFDRDLTIPASHVEGAIIEEGWLTAGPIDFDLPIQIFDINITIPAKDATFRLKLDDEGGVRGYMSGRVSAAEIRKIADDIDGGGDVADLIVTVVEGNADLSPDENGVCQDVSVTLEFNLTPAFLFEEPG